MSVRLMLIDDHRMFREALRVPLTAVPDFEVVAESGTGEAVAELVERTRPDVLVVDVALPDINGIEVVRRVGSRHPSLGIVALSGYADKLFVEEMLKAGAGAYVLKSAGTDELVAAIRAVLAGHVFLSPELTAGMLRHPSSPAAKSPPLSVLSLRERDVLRLVAAGRRATEIADELGITAGTVHVHRRNLRKKLGFSSTAELTRYAVREGILAV